MKHRGPKFVAKNKKLLIIALAFAILGSIFLIRSFAANPNLPGDVNNDNKVTITDLSILLSNFGKASSTVDLNGDGQVTITDLSILLTNYGKTYSGNPNPNPNPGSMPPITVSGNRIMRNGQPWWLHGYNSFVWSGNCGHAHEKMSTAQVDAWFATMRRDGHAGVRLFFYRGWSYDRLDAALASAKKYNVYLTITLDDAIGGCGENDKTAAWFDNPQERADFKEHMTTLLNRYKGEPAIAWFEYFNEPDHEGGRLTRFYDEMGAAAAAIDPTRLWSSGTVAPYWVGSEANFRDISSSPGVDIVSLHEYDGGEVESNHGPKVRANSAGKPTIAGEVGFQRNKPWEGCDGDVTGMVNRVRNKAIAYKGPGYAGAFFWAWQPGSNCGKGLDQLTGVHDALRQIQ